MAAPKKLIAGNWKMNGLQAEALARLSELTKRLPPTENFDMVLCPPFTLVSATAEAVKNTPISCGGQDCHAQKSGAYTGNISAEMLKDAGCTYVILGHSERRQYEKETSEQVRAKAEAAHAAGLIAIVCVGETDAERTTGQAEKIVLDQLSASLPAGATPENTVVAYEPVWAIGTGKTASAEDIIGMHKIIRGKVNNLRILYGGSVKGSNAAEILHIDNVDGVLVGGASLKNDEFLAIAKAA